MNLNRDQIVRNIILIFSTVVAIVYMKATPWVIPFVLPFLHYPRLYFVRTSSVVEEPRKIQKIINYILPIIPQIKEFAFNSEDLTKSLESILKGFGVDARVLSVSHGPVITTYEVKLLDNNILPKALKLTEKIKIALMVNSVRISQNNTLGTLSFELQNRNRISVMFKEVIGGIIGKTNLNISLGVNTRGVPVSIDLRKMPHLLIAGTTGSGKSVSVHSMISSLLYKNSPNELKLILIDPKRIEFTLYEGLPHLQFPIAKTVESAMACLQWAVREMENRYNSLSIEKLRSVEEYNARFPKAALPLITIVIDEFADLMLSKTGNEVESLVVRLAQKSRACGIHLIVATQRPTVDVVTGLIKANMPARLSYRVASKIDSKVILDTQGAENLTGNGDGLLLDPQQNSLVRVHSAFINEQDIKEIVDFWIKQGGEVSQEPTLVSTLPIVRNVSLTETQRLLKLTKAQAFELLTNMKEKKAISNIIS